MNTAAKLHLLAVEDDVGDFRQLRTALRERNPERYIVRHASNVDQAVQTLYDERFDVILLDISLPDLAVDEQIATFRRAAPDALILALGAHWDGELAARAINAGAQDFLIKTNLADGRLAHAIDIAIVRHGAASGDEIDGGLLQTLLDEVSELAIVVDSAGFLKSGHESLERVLEHRPAELRLRSWIQLLHPEDQNAVRKAWNALILDAGATQYVTARLPHPNGRWRDYYLRLTNRLDDPVIEGVLITGPDITLATTRQAMFNRLAEVSRTFLNAPNQESAIHSTLALIGAEISASEVHLIRYDHLGTHAQPEAQILVSWQSDENWAGRVHPAFEHAVGTADVIERLQQSVEFDPIASMVQVAPRSRGNFDIPGSLVLVPIMTQAQLWGAVALVVQGNIIDWPNDRRVMLKSIADTIGLAMLSKAEPVEEVVQDDVDLATRILDSVGTGLLLFDRHGALRHANRAVESITGLEPEGLLKRMQPYIEKQEGPATDQVFKRADGTRTYARIEIMVLSAANGGPDGGIMTIQDVTNLYRAQHMMQGSQARLQAVMASADVALLTVDEHGRIETINPAGEEMFGIRGRAAIGKTLASLLPTPQTESSHLYVHDVLEPVRESVVDREQELLAVTHDGETFRVVVTIREFAYLGQPRYIVSIRNAGQTVISDERIVHQLQQLEALHRIDRVLSSTRDQQLILDVVADQVVMMPDVDIAIIRTFSDISRQLDLKAVRGLPYTARAMPYLLLGQGAIGRAAIDRRVVKIPRLQETLANDGDDYEFFQYQVGDGYAIPLIANAQLRGTLEVYRYDIDGISERTIHFLNRVATQAALAVEDTDMVAELERSKQLLEGAYEMTLEGWSRAMELRGVDTKGHSRRVMELAVQLGREMGLRDRELRALRRGALLHDIGKIAVPDSVLHKPGKLDADDWAKIREIPRHAMNLLSGNTFLRDASVVPYFHNEKWDGSGYPNGLVGETIPLPARIFAIVDVWDTLISDRPYRKAMTREEAIEQMASLSGTSFDPSILEVFLSMVSDSEAAATAGSPDAPDTPADADFIDLENANEELDLEIDARIVS